MKEISERYGIAYLNHRIQHPQRQPSLIETEVAWLPGVRVILGFVAVKKLEVVNVVNLLEQETHDSSQSRMLAQISIIQ